MIELDFYINYLETVKDDLTYLCDVYRNIFSPWITVNIETETPKKEEIDCSDVFLLQKLQAVLNKANESSCVHEQKRSIMTPKLSTKNKNTTEEDISVSNKIETSCVSNESSFVHEQKRSIMIPKLSTKNKNIAEEDISVSNKIETSCVSNNNAVTKLTRQNLIERKNTYTPVHIYAPFKTEVKSIKSRDFIKENAKVIRKRPMSSVNKNKNVKLTPLPIRKNNHSNKPVIESDQTNVNAHVENSEIQELLNDVSNEIKKLENENSTVSNNETYSVKTVNMTLEEVGDLWQVSKQLKKECISYGKSIKMLSNCLLEDMKFRSEKRKQTNLKINQQNFGINTPFVRSNILKKVVKKLIEILNFIDLDQADMSQILLLRCILTWCLEQFLDLSKYQSLNSKMRSEEIRPSQSSMRIRTLLYGDVSTSKQHSILQKYKEALYYTSCSFVSVNTNDIYKSDTVLATRTSSPSIVSLSVSVEPPFTLVKSKNDNKVIQPIRNCELPLLQFVIKQQMLCFYSLRFKNWLEEIRVRVEKNDKAATFYRQIFGLLTSKYPVMLKET